MKYEVYLTNFGYFIEGQFSSILEAILAGRDKGFEFSVHEVDGGKQVGHASGVSLTWHNYYDQTEV